MLSTSLLTWSGLLAGVGIALGTATAATAAPSGAAGGSGTRVLEFGPYLGAYDFDASTWFEDSALFGLRATARLSRVFLLDAEFDEVYTRRERSNNTARQISVAVHGRVEPLRSRLSPTLLAGVAFVGLDDSEDPDAFSEAYDIGTGLRARITSCWSARAEWLLRRQEFRVLTLATASDGTGTGAQSSQTSAVNAQPTQMWGRAMRVGLAYAF